ncbi:MAG TPA: hypothetical protein VLC52_12915, partial [Anaerolineae bacterium]|nr:hypothetical protein [Anaerolineae bacterium]
LAQILAHFNPPLPHPMGDFMGDFSKKWGMVTLKGRAFVGRQLKLRPTGAQNHPFGWFCFSRGVQPYG